jgi:hypothetical protein
MRAGLAVIAMLALSVTPVVAQGKTKGTAPVHVGTLAVEVVEVCEKFAKGDVLAVDNAIAKGWDAYESTGESPYVQSFNASKDLPGIGQADIFVLREDYPDTSIGYCRMDVIGPEGTSGNEAVQAIQNLDHYEGQSQLVSDGTFASLTAVSGNAKSLLLTHWSAESFVVQLTVITPKAEASN